MEVSMSDIQSGARAPDQPGTARQATDAATQAAGNVTDTAKEQARQVTGEVSAQARGVASDVRDRVTEQARTQNDRLAQGIRRMSDELDQMAAERGDSPARTVVSRVAEGGRQVADYLSQHGPEGVLGEVQDFARRRPGAFLATALVSGFVVGRLGKGVFGASESATGTTKPRSDAFVSDVPRVSPEPAYPTAGYPDTAVEPATGTYASTGTGTPVAVTDPYATPGGDAVVVEEVAVVEPGTERQGRL